MGQQSMLHIPGSTTMLILIKKKELAVPSITYAILADLKGFVSVS
jgi:hypothetical protein